MLKIRLMRIGAKQKPFYRVVAVDERSKRSGAYIELLGTYNPLTTPKEIKLKQDRIDHWVKQGAQLSTGFLRIIGKAPQRLPRKPKKEKQATGNSEQVKPEEAKPEEKVEEAVVEEVKPEVVEEKKDEGSA
ncbi:MAG: 30S ribosomal protein S16 [Candidatus Daviesbacteria bacterium]|nr:30S ribosomal protein S16 [Candidatus Daviesbacteria bacterium]